MRRILVVEDDPSALRLVSFILESAGYEVIPAVNGIEGLRKAQEEQPDLLMLDLMLPGSMATKSVTGYAPNRTPLGATCQSGC